MGHARPIAYPVANPEGPFHVKRTLSTISVRRTPGSGGRRGRLLGPGLDLPCALGRGGVVRAKREGDGGTPRGRFRILAAFYRADRRPRPVLAALPVRPLGATDGWCDDPSDRRYNRPVRLPFGPSHERMWRADRLYDVVLDLSYNRGPIRRGRGSAIFLHCAAPGFRPTEGCIAVAPAAMGRLLARIGPRTRIEIG